MPLASRKRWLLVAGRLGAGIALALACQAFALALESPGSDPAVSEDLMQLDRLAERYPKQALQKLEALPRPTDAASARRIHMDLVRASIYQAVGRLDESLAICVKLQPELETLESPYLRVRLGRILSQVYFDLGQLENAVAASEKELWAAEVFGNQDAIAQAQVDLAWGRAAIGDLTGATEAIALASGRARSTARRAEVENVAGYVAYISNDPTTAIDHLERAKRLYEADDNPRDAAAVSAMLGNNQARLRRFVEAEASLRSAIKLFEQTGDVLSVGSTLNSLADLQGQLGQTTQGLATSARALAIYRSVPTSDILARIHIVRARLLVNAGRTAAAAHEMRQIKPDVLSGLSLKARTQYLQVNSLIHANTGDTVTASNELRDADVLYGRQTESILKTQLEQQRNRLERQRLTRENEVLASTARWEQRTATATGLSALSVALVAVVLGMGLARQRKLTAKIQALADTDSLTGIYNRRRILDAGEKIHKRRQRDGGTFAFAIVDVDRFKEINDTYGHPAGDRALRAVVEAMQQTLRGGDIIGRYGGDEFAVLFTAIDHAAAQGVADRVRIAVSTSTGRAAGFDFPLTVSIGIATPQSEDEAFSQLVARADGALYVAKEGGRNLVVVG
ncbi:MAG TPA: diguanylate cyclase [Rhodocyclaceae bacterium]|nr:diguanylate cyclase [Rhodocyclaceae bacterium]